MEGVAMSDLINFLFGGFFSALLIEIIKSNSIRIKTKILFSFPVVVIGTVLFLLFNNDQNGSELPRPRIPAANELDGTYDLGVFDIGAGNDVISCYKQRITINAGIIGGSATCTFGYNIYGPKTQLNFSGKIDEVRYDATLYDLVADIELNINNTPSAKGLAHINMSDNMVRGINYRGSLIYKGYSNHYLDIRKIDVVQP